MITSPREQVFQRVAMNLAPLRSISLRQKWKKLDSFINRVVLPVLLLERAAVSQRVHLDNLPDGKVAIKVDGKIVNIAQTEEEAFKMADDLIAEAEKGGKHLDKIKLLNYGSSRDPPFSLEPDSL